MKHTGYMTVNDLPIEINGEKSIPEALTKAGIALPVFCNNWSYPCTGIAACA
jgi:NADH dehydrogenase/NADH:ubiquinone oxidoreductase subunit G